jgi:diguanylate cyclase (GGDEF)-like protein/PAS domain S-box-containing protein
MMKDFSAISEPGKRILSLLEQLAAASGTGSANAALDHENLSSDEQEALRLVHEAISKYRSADDYMLMKYKLTSDALGIGLWDMEVVGGDPVNPDNSIKWSPEIRQMLGFNDEQDFPNVLQSWSDRLHPEEKETVLGAVISHLSDHTGNTPFDIEYRMMFRDGEYRHIHAFGDTQRDCDGVPLRIAGALRDIDGRKRAQNQLTIMSSIVHNSHNFISYKNLNGECLYINPAATAITGFSQDELMDDYLGVLFGDKADEYMSTVTKDLLDSGLSKYEYIGKTKAGDNRTFAGSSFLIGEDAFATIAADVTETKKIETERIQAHETMLGVLNGIDAMIYATVPETGEILFINEQMKRHYGLEGQIVGKICYKVLQDGMDKKCPFCPCHKLDKDPNGTVLWEEHSTLTNRIYRNVDRYIDWLDGKKAHIQHSVDISDLIHTQESLKNLTVELQKALSEAEEANRANNAFLSRILHLEAETVKIYIDSLTNIYNRRYFDENAERLLKSLSRSGSALSLMMIDIDYFKKYNDTYGHSAGDNCLKTVADILSKNVPRTDDFVARYGGEEFVVVLPNTDEKGAHIVADRLLGSIRERMLPHGESEVADHVTISIGVTIGKVERKHSVDDFIRRADEMLYRSKQNGRNRYSFERL